MITFVYEFMNLLTAGECDSSKHEVHAWGETSEFPAHRRPKGAAAGEGRRSANTTKQRAAASNAKSSFS